jgi:hypothetical protein
MPLLGLGLGLKKEEPKKPLAAMGFLASIALGGPKP